jgi:hypothetical protein
LVVSGIPVDSLERLELSKPMPVFSPAEKPTTSDKYLASLVNRDCRVEFVAYADGKPVCLLTVTKPGSLFVIGSFDSEPLAVAVDKAIGLLGDGDLVSLPCDGELFYANMQNEVAFVAMRGSGYYGFEIASPVTTLAALGDAVDKNVRALTMQYPFGGAPMGGTMFLAFLFDGGNASRQMFVIVARYALLIIAPVFLVSMIVAYIVLMKRERDD